MKKYLAVIFIFVFGLILIQPAFAQLEEKKVELKKIGAYIKFLDTKIVKARKARQINRLARLKELKRLEIARAEKLRKEIAGLESVPGGRYLPKQRVGRKRGFCAGVGYGGGSGVVKLGYVIPSMRNSEVIIDLGYGLGNSFNITLFEVSGRMPLGRDNFAGLELSMANYSQSVTDVPGISGTIGAGSRTGFGVFAGRWLGKTQVQVGYNSALGLTVGAIYKF